MEIDLLLTITDLTRMDQVISLCAGLGLRHIPDRFRGRPERHLFTGAVDAPDREEAAKLVFATLEASRLPVTRVSVHVAGTTLTIGEILAEYTGRQDGSPQTTH